MPVMVIVDAHLDLAYNALRGRDMVRAAAEQIPVDDYIPSVGLPDLRRAGVGLICATIFCEPAIWKETGYRTSEGAHKQALSQFAWYEQQVAGGELLVVRTGDDVPTTAANRAIPVLLLLEGADAIRTPEDAGDFFERGVRIVGLAWSRTRYAGGTRAPGPLTHAGVELVPELDRLGIIHDASHLAEESFWQLLDLSDGPVMASHSNCRSITTTEPPDRHLTDDMIRAIGQRGGVIGINFYDKFLMSAEAYGKRRANLGDIVAHVRRICDMTGSTRHAGLGSDMDGGFGQQHIPDEIGDSGDLPKIAEALRSAGFSETETAGVMGGNWLGFFARNLTSAAARK